MQDSLEITISINSYLHFQCLPELAARRAGLHSLDALRDCFGLDLLRKHQLLDLVLLPPNSAPLAYLPNLDRLEPGGRHFVFSQGSPLFSPHPTILYGSICSFKKGDSSNPLQLMATPSISENVKAV